MSALDKNCYLGLDSRCGIEPCGSHIITIVSPISFKATRLAIVENVGRNFIINSFVIGEARIIGGKLGCIPAEMFGLDYNSLYFEYDVNTGDKIEIEVLNCLTVGRARFLGSLLGIMKA